MGAPGVYRGVLFASRRSQTSNQFDVSTRKSAKVSIPTPIKKVGSKAEVNAYFRKSLKEHEAVAECSGWEHGLYKGRIT